LNEVVVGVHTVAENAKKMKAISLNQAESMDQADLATAKIAEIVQNNSAAAQETSATSEELTAQATALSGLVSKFRLRD
jgi:methyl-accepting chemotaxis protein